MGPPLSYQAQQALETKCKEVYKEVQNTLRRKDVTARAMKLEINKLLQLNIQFSLDAKASEGRF